MSSQELQKDVEWIYKGVDSEIDKEDYLLGKKVDKAIEEQTSRGAGTLGQINAVEYDCTPGSIFSSSASHQVDLQRKLQEDPLMEWKKKEAETRLKLLDNPIKLKQLKLYMEKTKKCKKKKKKRKHESSDDEDLDAKLLKKISSLRNGDDDDDDIVEAKPKKKKKDKDKRVDKYEQRNNESKYNRSPNYHSSRSHSKDSREHKRFSSDKFDQRYEKSRHHRDKHRDKHTTSKRDSPRRNEHEQLQTSSKEEKLAEMMKNAKWREDQRKSNIKRYEKEAEMDAKNSKYEQNPDFIKRQLKKVTESSSVAKRIQSNKHYIQRSNRTMNENFVRR